MKEAPPLLVLAALTLGCASDEPDTGAECNDITNDAPVIEVDFVNEPAPGPDGGTIAEGVYELSGQTMYREGPAFQSAPPPTSAILDISGDEVQQVGSIDGEERRYTSKWTTSGKDLTITYTCPTADTAEFRYTATADELHIISNVTDWTLEQTYTRR